MVRLLTLISGAAAVIVPNVGSFGLPVATQAAITGIGGGLLAILALLEHPTTKTAATKPPVKGS